MRWSGWRLDAVLSLALIGSAGAAGAQQGSPPKTAAEIASIHRLVLVDGSYQAVKHFELKGDRVRYVSAERSGEWEEIPARLVDWVATEKYAREHLPGAAPSQSESEAAAVDKEALAERAEQAARTPEVQPGLRLPDQDGVWALDYFHDQPQLVTMEQNSGDLNQRTGHNVLMATVNPLAGTKQQVELDGAKSKVRLHGEQPVLFVSLTGANDEPGPDAVTVDTHGAKMPAAQSAASSRYVVVRVDSNTKRNFRVVSSVKLSALGRMSHSEDLVETTAQVLPGGHWMKILPKASLLTGEYALMEVLGPKQINLSVWDFAIDPAAPENRNTILPLERGR